MLPLSKAASSASGARTVARAIVSVTDSRTDEVAYVCRCLSCLLSVVSQCISFLIHRSLAEDALHDDDKH